MTKLIIRYDEIGTIENAWYEANHDYEPDEDELLAPETMDHRDLDRYVVNVDANPPKLVPDPEAEWQRPGVVDADTREIIAEKFRDAGADAIQALDGSDAAAFMDATIRMQYLTYVSLTGDRIETVENRFF